VPSVQRYESPEESEADFNPEVDRFGSGRTLSLMLGPLVSGGDKGKVMGVLQVGHFQVTSRSLPGHFQAASKQLHLVLINCADVKC
jgi:hypothetical protein